MKVIGSIVPSAVRMERPSVPPPTASVEGRAASGGCGRSLIPIAPGERAERRHIRLRTSAAFLAHLIATAQQAPQTRARRRAEPAEAAARYAAAASLRPPGAPADSI